jgi:hypothetical protein
VRTAYRRAAIQNLADQEYELDGMIFTAFNNEWTLEEIQELFSNRDMKFAYYDINDQTREQLENGNLLVVSCGQHNVFGLCFAYLYGFLNQNLKKEEMLALSCDYLRLSSVSDYDTYIQYCVEEMPYDAQTIQTIADSLNEGTELLEEYCRTYSLETIAK